MTLSFCKTLKGPSKFGVTGQLVVLFVKLHRYPNLRYSFNLMNPKSLAQSEKLTKAIFLHDLVQPHKQG